MRASSRWIVGVVLTIAAASHAEAPGKSEAAAHFERGIQHTKRGEFAAAVEAFEAAYRTSPHYSVLYNLGQAYVTLGRPVEAVQTLERFLREGADRIAADRRGRVEQVLSAQRARIGSVEIDVTPDGAEVFVDGLRRGADPLAPVDLAAGVHVVLARKTGHAPQAQTIEVRPSERVRLTLKLEPESEPQPVVGQIHLRCEVPGVEIEVDGVRRGTTPLDAPLLVPAGDRTLSLKRFGYQREERVVSVVPSGVAELTCRLAPDPASRGAYGSLQIAASERFASVFVDGLPYRGHALPPGPHALRVERGGFHTLRRVVSIEPGRRHRIDVRLEPTPARVAEIDAAGTKRRIWAVGTGIAGLALAGGAATLYAWNAGRYEDWRGARDRVEAQIAGGQSSPELYQNNRALSSRAADIRRVDDVAIGLAVAGGGALVTGAILWLTGSRSERAARR